MTFKTGVKTLIKGQLFLKKLKCEKTKDIENEIKQQIVPSKKLLSISLADMMRNKNRRPSA